MKCYHTYIQKIIKILIKNNYIKIMKIYNAFGIKPTNTYVSAGSDYYIPNIDDFDIKK